MLSYSIVSLALHLHRYFHHVYSRHKIRAIVSWVEELRLGGFLLTGKPGALGVEGEEESVKELVERVRRLPWQKMQSKVRNTSVHPASSEFVYTIASDHIRTDAHAK